MEAILILYLVCLNATKRCNKNKLRNPLYPTVSFYLRFPYTLKSETLYCSSGFLNVCIHKMLNRRRLKKPIELNVILIFYAFCVSFSTVFRLRYTTIIIICAVFVKKQCIQGGCAQHKQSSSILLEVANFSRWYVQTFRPKNLPQSSVVRIFTFFFPIYNFIIWKKRY